MSTFASVLSVLLATTQTPPPTVVKFAGQSGTGGIQEWKVPEGIKSITVKLWGAGGGGNKWNAGGCGDFILAEVPVTPGETLMILVGGGGYPGSFADGPLAAFAGGGKGSRGDGAGGGGATILRRGLDYLVVAAGGGGAGTQGPGGHAGLSGGYHTFGGPTSPGRPDGPPVETPTKFYRHGQSGKVGQTQNWSGESASDEGCGGGGGGIWGGGAGKGDGGAGGGGLSSYASPVKRLPVAWDTDRRQYAKFGKSQTYFDFARLDTDWSEPIAKGGLEGRNFGGPGQCVIVYWPSSDRPAVQPNPSPNPAPSPDPGPSIAEQARREEELRRRRNEQALMDRVEKAFIEEATKIQREYERLDKVLIPDERNQSPAYAGYRKTGSEMVYIPQGRFWRGDLDSHTNRGGLASLSGYWIDVAPVRVDQFRRFSQATGMKFDWEGRKPSWGWLDDHPMVNVTYDEARAYCTWAGGDLPTEAQWEKAARGRDARQYPWGNQWDATKAFGDRPGTRKSTVPAETLTEGRSFYAVVGLVGNVKQWCRDWFSDNIYKEPVPNNPFANKAPVFNKTRVVRGASFGNTKSTYCLTYYRSGHSPGKKENWLGFRCVIERGRLNPANSDKSQ